MASKFNKKVVKRIIPTVLVLAILLSLCLAMKFSSSASSPDDFVCSKDDINKTAMITIYIGSGGKVEIPAEIGGYSVTSIGNGAFKDKTGLTSVTIPNSVTSIGNMAFNGCTGLTIVTIGNYVESIGNSAFLGCAGLTSVTIPNSVKSIGGNAFKGCTGLTSVTIGNTVASIGDYAFDGCTRLTEVKIPDSVMSISGNAFQGCTGLTSVTIGNSVTSIGNYAFYGCTGLASVTIGNSVESIGRSAFYNCKGLMSISIPNTVKSIGNMAFFGCTKLPSISIPNTVTNIGDNAFAICTELTTVYIKNPDATVQANSFSNCSALEHVYIKGTESKIGNIFGSRATVHFLDEIKVTKEPTKQQYQIGEDLDTTGLAITAYYDDKVEETDKIEPTAVSGFDSAKGGMKEVTVSYSGLTDTFEVEVVKIFTGITVKEPTKTQYIEGQNLDTAGMVVTAQYNDGTSEPVTSGYTLSTFNPTMIGKQTITVSYNGKSATFDVTVVAKTLTGITVTPPTKTTYIEGQNLDTMGMSVTAQYNDGTSEPVTSGYTLSTFNPTKIGTQTITVSYNGKSATFDVTVAAKTLTGITVTTPPTKTQYIEGQKLDTAGMVVTANYDNGTSETVTDYTVSGFDPAKIGKQTITVSYKGKSTAFEVEVVAKTLTGITVTPPTKTTYIEGQDLDTTGMVVTANYDNGTSETVTSGYTLSTFDPTKIGTQTITVSYNGKSTTFDVTVVAKTLTGITVTPPTKTTYIEGRNLDKTGMVVTANYDNGTSETVTDYTVSDLDTAKIGTQKITVSHKGKNATFDVTVVAKTLTGITVTPPTKTTYIEGQSLDKTGMVVTANYDNGTREPVTDYTVSDLDTAKIGTQKITVSHKGKNATFDVTVVAKTLTGITVTPPNKTQYIEGQSLDKTGMVVTAQYDNGTSETVTDYTVSGFDPAKIGTQIVTVTYGDKTDTFEAEVKASEPGSVPEQETKPDNEPEQENKPTPSPENNPEAENKPNQSSENSSKTEDKSEPDTSEKTLPDSTKTGDSPVYFAALCLTLAAGAALPVLVRGKRKKEAQ